MSKVTFSTALALMLTLGTIAGAFAGDSGYGHDRKSSYHTSTIDRSAQVLAYNEHGGGHEQAEDNAAIHKREMSAAKNLSDTAQTPPPAYDQHGGGHEQAQDNEAIHDKEMQDPEHKD